MSVKWQQFCLGINELKKLISTQVVLFYLVVNITWYKVYLILSYFYLDSSPFTYESPYGLQMFPWTLNYRWFLVIYG